MFEKICLILLANLVFFLKTLGYKYASDDLPVFHNPPVMKNKFMKLVYWVEGRYRHHPQWDHLLTMLIHALVCVFIYLAFGANDISFLAAFLFMLNPSNNQASIWISGRSYALAAFGLTAALAFPALSLFFIVLATYYNPGFLSAVVLALSWVSWIAMFIPVAWAIHYKRFKRNVKFKVEKEMFTEDKALKWEKIPLVLKTFGFYTTLALIPFRNSFYHSFLQSVSGSGVKKAYTFKDRFFWLGLIYASAIITYWLVTPWSVVSFCLLWWIVCFAPFLNFMRMSQEIAERYIYLPNVGLMVFLATLIQPYPVIAAVFLAMYATRLWFYMDCYQDDYYLLEHSCLNDPAAWFAWHVRGMKRWDNKSFQEAVIIWTMARLISPKEFKVNFNLATALKMSGHHKEAEEFLKIAEDNIPEGQDEANKLLKQWREGNLSIIL